ncbi:hypothetical protein ACLB2K_008883 [Fragaria x ananassa]
MVFLAENCPNLQFLDLSGTNVTGAGVRAFSGHRCLESLDLYRCGEFCWSDIEYMVLGCQSLKQLQLHQVALCGRRKTFMVCGKYLSIYVFEVEVEVELDARKRWENCEIAGKET